MGGVGNRKILSTFESPIRLGVYGDSELYNGKFQLVNSDHEVKFYQAATQATLHQNIHKLV